MTDKANQVKLTLKQSALNAKDDYDYKKIVNDREHFIPCTYEKEEEEITFSYNMDGLTSLSELKKEKRKKRYDFLVNFSRIKGLLKEYKIKLDEDNLYYDENYMPYIKLRDIYDKGDAFSEEEFIYQYKCFVAGLVGNSKYSVSQIQKGGIEAVKHDKVLTELLAAETEEDLVAGLREKRAQLEDYLERTEVTVSRGKFTTYKAIAIVGAVLTVLLAAATAYFGFYELPYEKAVRTANEGFIGYKYTQCIDSLAEYENDRFDINTKYILAVSYARSESFKKEEITNIVDKLSQTSNEQEMDYWIYLGRNQLSEAQNIALSLSDDKLLIYAYMKEVDLVENDRTMNGEEKQQKLSQLQSNIENIGKKYVTDEESVSGK